MPTDTDTLPVPCSTCDNVVDMVLDPDLVTPAERAALAQGRAAFQCDTCVETRQPAVVNPEYAIEVYVFRRLDGDKPEVFSRQAHRVSVTDLATALPHLVAALPGLLLNRGYAAAAEEGDRPDGTAEYSVDVCLWRDDDLLHERTHLTRAESLLAALRSLQENLPSLMVDEDFVEPERQD